MLNRKQKLSVLLITLGTLILAAVPIGIRRRFFVVNNVSTNDVLVSIIFPAIIMLILLSLPFLAQKTFPTLSNFNLTWTQKHRAKIRWYFLLYLAPLVLGIIVGMLSKQTGLPTMKFFNFKDVTQLTVTFIIWLVIQITILTPIAEEVFWRGFIQNQFSKCFGGTIAVLLQALLFALAHRYPFLGFISVFVFGLIAGFWRLKRRSLVPIIIAHAIMNGLWCLGYYPDQYEMSKKNISVNYVEEINKLGYTFPIEDNADIDYQKALDLYHQPSDALYNFKIIRKNLWPDELTSDQQQVLERWLIQNKGTLIQFRQATRKPYYWPHYTGNMMMEADNSVDYSQLVELACALMWNARFQAGNGDIEQAIDDLVGSFHFGNQSLAGPKPIISFLVGMGIKGNACDTMFLIIDKTELNAEQLESFQKQLQRKYQNAPSSLDLIWEKFTLYDTIQRIFTDDGDGNGHVPRAEFKGQKIEEMLDVMSSGVSNEKIEIWKKSDRKKTTELVDELFVFFNEVFPKTPAQLKNENIDIASKIAVMAQDNILYIYIPSIDKIHLILHKNKAVQDALTATLAALSYEKVNHSFPENLEVLVSEGYLDRMPMDPFSDHPLIYKKENDNFLLYSLGMDFDDDGGCHDENWGKTDGDYVFWPVQINSTQ